MTATLYIQYCGRSSLPLIIAIYWSRLCMQPSACRRRRQIYRDGVGEVNVSDHSPSARDSRRWSWVIFQPIRVDFIRTETNRSAYTTNHTFCPDRELCNCGLHLIMHRTIGLTGYIGPLTPTLTLRKVKVKADIALHGNPISELRDVTCHMGSPATRHK